MTADLLTTAALAVGLAGVVLGLLTSLSTRSAAAGLAVLLDLLLAAGLLRLASAYTWTAIGTAAAVVAVRTLARRGIAVAGRARGGARPA